MELTKGDTEQFKFQRRNSNGTVITTQATKVYFTVKANEYSKVVLQKTIDDMTFDLDGTYHFTIEPSDTDELQCGNYKYDIEVIVNDYKKTISKGDFIINSEITTVKDEM